MWIYLGGSILFILIAGFFAGSETAFISINRIKLHSFFKNGKRRSKLLEIMTNHPEDMVGVFLVGTNVCVVTATILFTVFLSNIILNARIVPLLVTLSMTPIVLLLSDVFPKIIFRKFADNLMFSLTYFYFALFILLYPVQFIFVKFINFCLTVLGLKKKKKGTVSKDEFKILLDISINKGSLREKEKEFIESIMNFKNIIAREVMVPLNRIICIEESSTLAIAATKMLTAKHSRLPVYRSRVDNIIGFIENKDMIEADKEETVQDYVRQALYVPETAPIDNVLLEMQSNGSQMVFTIDEYGGASGVITTQDLITEIVGEFMDMGESLIKKDGDVYMVDGFLDIDELYEELGIVIQKNNFETLAGFVMFQLEKIPEAGDKFDYKNYTFEVVSMSGLRIKQIKIYKKKKFKRKNIIKE